MHHPTLPPEPRLELLRDTARRHGLTELVETGTCDGSTIEALRDDFDTLITIEADTDWHRYAAERFSHDAQVSCLLGDSTDLLGGVLATLDRPALLWLDAHYFHSDCPILEELDAVAQSDERHVVLADDANLMRTEASWPDPAEVKAWAAQNGYAATEALDVLVLEPT